jgi:hypothetical protein
MSKGQTFRSEDNAFLPPRRRQLSVRCVTALSKWRRRAKRRKDFETEHSVSSLLQVRPALNFYCGIRDERRFDSLERNGCTLDYDGRSRVKIVLLASVESTIRRTRLLAISCNKPNMELSWI